ncbi:MAG: glycerol-3-phosphate 1-O-acyltransferase PlsY [Pseudomonadota bacterium]
MPDPISWAAVWPYYALVFLAGYVAGSIPFGLILTKLAGLGDVRAIGSGNIGATNVLRTGRKDLAAGTLLLDGLKGTLIVLAAHAYGGQDLAVTAALGAFLGHLFPVWLRFRGGKGVATYIGCLLALSPLAGGAFALVWIGVARLFRFSSLAALVASFATPFVLVALDHFQFAELFGVLTALLWWKHRENIARLLSGTEGKIGGK